MSMTAEQVLALRKPFPPEVIGKLPKQVQKEIFFDVEREGVIGGYTVRVHEVAERGHIRAHIMITVLPRQMAAVADALRAMPEIRTLHSVSGPFDLVAIGVVPAIAEMDELTDRIGGLDGVERTTSSIILSAKFER